MAAPPPAAPGAASRGESRNAAVSMPRGNGAMRPLGFLFLQGDAGPFFNRLGIALHARGHRVARINLCGGDRLYWRGLPALDHHGRAGEFDDLVARLIEDQALDHVLLAGDCRPMHRRAAAVARRLGSRVLVFEEGYFRPHWFTLEEHGVNGYSRLPRDPDWFRQRARSLAHSPPASPVGAELRHRAAHDLAFHLANAVLRHRYPHYRTHRPHNAAVEYAGWAVRFAAKPVNELRARRRLHEIDASRAPLFLLPLQLEADTQIQEHSPFDSMGEVLSRVCRSFAQHAPPGSLLLIKRHPIDTGLVSYAQLLRRLERELGLHGRLRYVDGGRLEALYRRVRGVVTVNSTVGASALAAGCPVIALGTSIYDLPGLTHQGSLDEFWNRGQPPDPALLQAFRDVVMALTQINGNFWTPRGIRLGVSASVQRLEALAGQGAGTGGD